MKLQVAKEILDQADRCLKKYKCLDGHSTYSTAEAHFVGEQRFLCHDPEPCAYKFPFGRNSFCTCPVRKEIFKQSGR